MIAQKLWLESVDGFLFENAGLLFVVGGDYDDGYVADGVFGGAMFGRAIF
tara:strand:+ start:125 stop:274 length:150 start_codon:yes stop_codon:yes gene_type:complete